MTVYHSIAEIETPAGFTRIPAADDSFAGWLRSIPLKEDKTVYLYNGTKKRNQAAQFAVIDIPTGNKDLQQCADVVMRLRAEYLYKNKLYKDIAFMDYAGKWYRWNGGDNRGAFDNYLQNVFGWCGSASLEKQLKTVSDFRAIKPGDVLVQGGFPGHAVIAVDMAVNAKGQKVYMLAQGYQPAQDMHVLLNPNDPGLSPWYAVDGYETGSFVEQGDIITPEWTFNKTNLKTW
ncbi:MAG TPA: DUF4846 domain-containing protein [Chitinophagaceae bacterium]|jgi:hypothetical protein|nr:DUF4846 domain-containing protein [Chitinophagaceae bacterium]